MGRTKKSTRKFESKHLKKTLEDRKVHAKAKQRHQLNEKRKKKRAVEDHGSDDDAEQGKEKKRKKKDGEVELFEDMTVEQFFQGGFEVPKTVVDKKEKKEKKRKRGEEEDELDAHKADLEALAEKDPEFFRFLQENDSELLDFKGVEVGELSGVDETSEGRGEGEETKKEKKKKKKKKKKEEKSSKKPDEEEEEVGEEEEQEGGGGSTSSVELTLEDVKTWRKALVENQSLNCLKKVVLAFRAAAHVSDVGDKSAGYKYSITNPDVYHELLVVALKNVPGVLNHHLPVKESVSGKVRISSETRKYRTLSPLLNSYSSSLLHLLPTLTDAPTQKLLLNSAIPLIPYFLSFRKFLRSFVKAVVDIWSSNSADESARITAFLAIRKIVVVGDEGLKETSLKALYAGFVRASRQTSGHTMQGINLMKNSAGEIVGLEGMGKAGYSGGFGYIRQLAVHLRNSITNNSKESYRTVYNWQYVHSLDFWSRALATHCDGLKEAQAGKESPLRPLIYPLTQVTLGAIKLIPTAQYFPLRFYLIRSLLRLSRSTGVYIPLTSLIFEVLSSAGFKKKAKPSTLRLLDFSLHIRAPKAYLQTKPYQDGVSDQVVELLSEFFVLHAKSIAFPELAIPTIVLAKRWIKKSSNVKLNNALSALVARLEANAKWVQERRNKVEFAPDKLDQVDAFLKEEEWEKTPLGSYVISQRRVREERRRMLEESLEAERGKGRGGGEEGESDGEDMDMDMGIEEEGEDEEMDDSNDE